MVDRGGEAAAAPRSAAALAAALVDAREYTKSLYAHLTPSQRRFPQRPEVNPAAWELGHIGWFQEFWCRRHRRDNPAATPLPSRLVDADRWWNSSLVPHATRWSLPLPDARGVEAWLDLTLADTLEALAASRDGERYFFELALYHEDMHAEAMLMTLQALGLPAPPEMRSTMASATTAVLGRAVAPDDQDFAGGLLVQGAQPAGEAPHFVFDNEKWAHPVTVAPFAMARSGVTNAQFAAFVETGGYAASRWWSDAGWAWREAAAARHPANWRPAAEGWQQRVHDAWLPLEPGQPVMHVNAYEAEAYCHYAGRRLPTEAEWEFAARHGHTTVAPRLDHHHRLPGPAAAGDGVAHLLGNVWEWTASAFLPYPGFTPDPYADYSAPWFGDHRVLKGGSFATRSRLARAGFRNFYLPHRSDPFVGFRTCALQHEAARR